jgi:hypothetical protein
LTSLLKKLGFRGHISEILVDAGFVCCIFPILQIRSPSWLFWIFSMCNESYILTIDWFHWLIDGIPLLCKPNFVDLMDLTWIAQSNKGYIQRESFKLKLDLSSFMIWVLGIVCSQQAWSNFNSSFGIFFL